MSEVVSANKIEMTLQVIEASLRDHTEMFWLSVKNRLSQGQSIGESYEVNLIDRMAIGANYFPEKIKECFWTCVLFLRLEKLL